MSKIDNMLDKFMHDYVNLDSEVVKQARKSKDNLLENIKEFNNEDFFKLYPDIDLQFGSFSRKTKCRPLDDIDLIIGISADGATYNSNDSWDNVRITSSTTNATQQECSDNSFGYCYLNSTKVINKFKERLEHLPDYSRSEIKKNGEALTLNLISKEWAFDIVPAFMTVQEQNGRSYYLIPNGKGKWMKTDPRIDKQRIEYLQKNWGRIAFDAIRLFKYWNRRSNIKTFEGYFSECLLLNYFENNINEQLPLKNLFLNLLDYVREYIGDDLADPKDISGNINNLSINEINNVIHKINNCTDKIEEALYAEQYNQITKAINLWKDILGDEFEG